MEPRLCEVAFDTASSPCNVFLYLFVDSPPRRECALDGKPSSSSVGQTSNDHLRQEISFSHEWFSELSAILDRPWGYFCHDER